MVRIYKSQVGAQISDQHREIIDWLKQNSMFKDAYVLLEFQPPGREQRQIDMAILLSDRIHVLELKGYKFSEILPNNFWTYYDESSNEYKVLEKRVGGRSENPYSQAINTADAFKKWIREKKQYSTSSYFSRFLDSDTFKVFPIVYINKSPYLDESEIQRHNWCLLVYDGIEQLEEAMNRSWREFESKYPSMDEEFIKNVIDDLNLVSLDSALESRRGKDNTTLIAILEYVYKTPDQLSSENQVKDSVFYSGEKRLVEIRKALQRGKKEGLLSFKKGFYEVSPLIKALREQSYSMEEIYQIWPRIIRLDNERSQIPFLFNLYIKEMYPEVEEKKELLPSPEFPPEIPDSLLIYSFSDQCRFNDELEPIIFRMGGPIWIDFQKELITPFYDLEGKDLKIEVLNNIRNKNNVLIHGGASSGKTTLVKSLGLALISERIPVISLTPFDLDHEALKAIMSFERQNKGSGENNLVIIIENCHLATSTEAHWLNRLLRPLKNIQIIFTSRKATLDLAGAISENEQQLVRIDLDNQIDAKERTFDLTSMVLSLIFEGLVTKDIKELSNNICIRNAHNLILIQIELESAIQLALNKDLDAKGLPLKVLESVNRESLLKLLEKDEKLSEIVISHLIERFAKQVNQILERSDIPIRTAQKALILIFVYCQLELPLRSDQLAEVGKLEVDHIHKILRNLEQRGELLSTNEGFLMPHPLFAEKMIHALKTGRQEYQTLIGEIIDNLESYKGNTLQEKILHYLYDQEPAIKAEWVVEEDTQEYKVEEYSVVSLDRIKELAPELMVEDFLNLIFKVPERSWYGTDYKIWWRFWDDVGIDKLVTMISEAGSMTGIIYLLREIKSSKWPKFSELLEKIEPNSILRVAEADQYDSLDIAFRYLREWGYSQILYLEVEGLLRCYFSNEGFKSFHPFGMSLAAFEIIDNLPVESVLKEYQGNPEISIEWLLGFFKDTEKLFNRESVLKRKIIESILKDCLHNTSIALLCAVINHVDTTIDLDFFLDIIQGWDIKHIHDEFLKEDSSWLRYYVELLTKWQSEQIISVMVNSFTATEIKSIILNNNEEEHWIQILLAFKNVNWLYLNELLDQLGHRFFIDYLDADETQYLVYPLMKLLLNQEWEQKIQFIQEFDFHSWIKSHDQYLFVKLVKILDSEGIRGVPEMVQYFFQESIKKEWPERQLEAAISLCSDLGISWSQWVDINFLKEQVERNPSKGMAIIRTLEKYDWRIPIAIQKSIATQEEKQKRSLWERMTDQQRAHHLYKIMGEKEEGVLLYQKIAKELAQEGNLEEIQRFLHHIQNLEEDEVYQILSKLTPPLLNSMIPFDEYWLVETILEKLLKIQSPQLPKFIVQFYENIYSLNETQFWDKLEAGLDEKIKHEILTLLWNRENYQKIQNLPPMFNTLLNADRDKIVKILKEKDDYNPFLWEILVRIERESNNLEKVTLQTLIANILTIKTLHQITPIFINQKRVLDIFIQELGKSIPSISEILKIGKGSEIIHLLSLLDEEKNADHIKFLLCSLNKEEWQEIAKTTDLINAYILTNLLSKYCNIEVDLPSSKSTELETTFSRLLKRQQGFP